MISGTDTDTDMGAGATDNTPTKPEHTVGFTVGFTVAEATAALATLSNAFSETAGRMRKMMKDLDIMVSSARYDGGIGSWSENEYLYNLKCNILSGLYIPKAVVVRRTMFPMSGYLPWRTRRKRRNR